MTSVQRIGIAVVEHAGRYCVGVRSESTVLGGLTEFPGGKCEVGESPRVCAVRECREETGLLVVPTRQIATTTHTYDHGTVELHFWHCRLAGDLPEVPSLRPPFQWVAAEDLRQRTFPEGNRPAVEALGLQVQFGPRKVTTAILIVDHGSRRSESNAMLEQVTAEFRAGGDYSIVEPAHMELAEPDIRAAYGRCVEQGASRIIVFPYFLSPGRHWSEDIPRLVSEAADGYPGTEWLVTAPFGQHPKMREIIADRIEGCLQQSVRSGEEPGGCDSCDETTRCQVRSAAVEAE